MARAYPAVMITATTVSYNQTASVTVTAATSNFARLLEEQPRIEDPVPRRVYMQKQVLRETLGPRRARWR